MKASARHETSDAERRADASSSNDDETCATLGIDKAKGLIRTLASDPPALLLISPPRPELAPATGGAG